ncbi:MAG: Na+/H+ antiporter NhaC family protein [Bacteroidales bacterium]|nr:Na+/H+ antiporter NhaC family protein [Bacteroidales bacterium]
MAIKQTHKEVKGFLALTPLLLFICVYLGTSIIARDFYKVPLTVAFMLSSIYAVLITKGVNMEERISIFSKGAANSNILLMIWIFILAGAFAHSAKEMGSIEATVNLAIQLLPGKLLMAGIFLAACFISLSIGTSVGTIVALTPVAIGIADKAGIVIPLMVAIVVGGSFFGDNLSFISDTTIAATRTQDCSMKDKFKVNSMIVLPPAVIALLIYLFQGFSVHVTQEPQTIEWIKVLPYLLVLITALIGVNVMTVLMLGIFSTGIIGLLTGSFGVIGWFASMGTGIIGMGELIIITLMAGGMLEMVRYNGGIDYIIHKLIRHIHSKRGAELTIASLVSIANLCTANNTIAIITTGSLTKDISTKYGVDSRKSASILDTFSCFVQGIIPYGAQVLMASGLAAISPISIISYLYYPFLMGICAVLAILFRFPKKYS